MKIERVIDGKNVVIELTDMEMYDAYHEKEHLYDVEDVRSIWEMKRENDPDYPEPTEDELDRAAYQYRHAMNNTEDWVHQAEYAIGEVIAEREE